jgi:hypothetical protein
MTSEQFAYWLQGFMEVANPIELDSSQTAVIKHHLALVFNKQTPNRPLTEPNPLSNKSGTSKSPLPFGPPTFNRTDSHDFPFCASQNIMGDADNLNKKVIC